MLAASASGTGAACSHHMCTSCSDRPGLFADMNQREQTSMKPLLVINMVRGSSLALQADDTNSVSAVNDQSATSNQCIRIPVECAAVSFS